MQPRKPFVLEETNIGRLYQLYNRSIIAKNLYKAYGVMNSRTWMVKVGLAAAEPLAKFVDNSNITTATNYIVTAVSFFMSPITTVSSLGMNWMSDKLLQVGWDNLSIEQQESKIIQETMAFAHVVKSEGIAQITYRIEEASHSKDSKQTENQPKSQPINTQPKINPVTENSIDSLNKKGYWFYKHINGETEGAHMSIESAKNYIANGGTVEAKKYHKKWTEKKWISNPPPSNSNLPVNNPKEAQARSNDSYVARIFNEITNWFFSNRNNQEQKNKEPQSNQQMSPQQESQELNQINQQELEKKEKENQDVVQINQQVSPQQETQELNQINPQQLEKKEKENQVVVQINQQVSPQQETQELNQINLQELEKKEKENQDVVQINQQVSSQQETQELNQINQQELEKKKEQQVSYPQLLNKFGCYSKKVTPVKVVNALWLIDGTQEYSPSIATKTQHQFTLWAKANHILIDERKLEEVKQLYQFSNG